MQAAKRTPVDLRAWAVGLMEKDNRKSHLAPQPSPTTQDALHTTDSPTSGEIPIAGAISSPRDHHQASQSQNRSPTRNGLGSLGRAAGSSAHPGLGQRSTTSGSIPKAGPSDAGLPASANAGTFSLPVRGAPGSGLPPPPPRKETPDELRREGRRQGAFGSISSNGGYGGYPSK